MNISEFKVDAAPITHAELQCELYWRALQDYADTMHKGLKCAPYLMQPCRTLPVSIAHRMHETRPNEQERLTLLNRAWAQLSPQGKMQCDIELSLLRQGKQGRVWADIA